MGSKLDGGRSFTAIRRCRVLNIEEWMMKSFRIVSADVKSDKSSVESFAAGRDAKVVVRFDRPLTKLEALRVSKEAAKFVGDEDRVSCSSSSLTVRTRDFDSVREFVEVANASAGEWCADVAAEVERAKAVLVGAAESLGSVVVCGPVTPHKPL